MFLLNHFFSSEINGTITAENGTPQAWANIIEKGTLNETQTDFDGNYVLNGSSESVILVVSYMGFRTEKIALNGKNTVDFILEEAASELDEVIVVGYGSEEKRI